MNQNYGKFYQVSTLQALALGFSKSVITVKELLTQSAGQTATIPIFTISVGQ